MLRLLVGMAWISVGIGAGCATPEAVVRSALEASERGDVSSYEACFTPRSRPVLRTLQRATGPLSPKLGTGKITVSERPGGARAWGRRVVTVSDGSRQVQLVLRGEAGAWRIDLIDTERRAASSGGRP